MKVCTKCKVEQTIESFSWKKKGVSRSTVCKTCHKKYRRQHYLDNRQIYIDKARRWETEHGGKRQIKHGVSDEQFNILKSKYDGKCWICRNREATHIDHDHSCCSNKFANCGKCIRGVLCNQCNSGLGLLGDNLESLLKAVEYLRNNMPLA